MAETTENKIILNTLYKFNNFIEIQQPATRKDEYHNQLSMKLNKPITSAKSRSILMLINFKVVLP